MAKLTLLQLTQKILSSMQSDNVNSILDTQESQDVADLVEQAYYEIVNEQQDDWKFLQEVRELEGAASGTQPTRIKIPDTVGRVDQIKYDVTLSTDTNSTYRVLKYKEPDEFLRLVHARNTGDSNVTAYDNDDGVPLFIKTDEMPTYYTSFDDVHIFLDSYDSSEESTVQQSKTVATVYKNPTFTQSDSFTPDLPDNMFMVLLNHAKALAHFEIDQRAHGLAQARAKIGMTKAKRQHRKADNRNRTVNYGRNIRGRRKL